VLEPKFWVGFFRSLLCLKNVSSRVGGSPEYRRVGGGLEMVPVGSGASGAELAEDSAEALGLVEAVPESLSIQVIGRGRETWKEKE